MLDQRNEILWGDRWGIENSTAWFVSGKFNVLFSVDMITDHYKIVATLPGRFDSYRKNSNCIKCDDTIFCMPDKGDCIWCYDLLDATFQKIEIINPTSLNAGIGDFWRCGGILWAVSSGLKQILEIDIKKKKVIGYYNITAEKDERLAKSAKDENYIYIVSASKGRIYIFDIAEKRVKLQDLPGIENGLRTISAKGEKIWLSGYKKEIYVWNQSKNEIEILNNFPLNFGIYNFDRKERLFLDCRMIKYDTFTFLESLDLGGYIWFIPFQTNQILYVNKNTYEINVFEVYGEDEKEGERGIKRRQINCKYVLQYVCEDRYIGLYSLKNEIVYEIDTKTLKMKKRSIIFDTDNLEKNLGCWILNESFDTERRLFGKLIGGNMERVSRKECVGERIHLFVQ